MVFVLTSILLHNSLFKFSVAFYKSGKDAKPPLKAGSHPLAWMLMLCDELQCWDRPVDYDMVRAFNREQTDIIGAMEHERWVREHVDQGWISGDLYEKADMPAEASPLSREDENVLREAWREQLRMHKLAMDGNPVSEEIRAHYDLLPEEDKGKDYEPFNSMLKLVRKFDGLRIYQL